MYTVGVYSFQSTMSFLYNDFENYFRNVIDVSVSNLFSTAIKLKWQFESKYGH